VDRLVARVAMTGMTGAAPHAVWFRCAAGPGVGLGHVSRCLALAELFEDVAGIRASFVVSSSSRRALRLIRDAGFPCTARSGRGAQPDADRLARRLGDGDIVVIDDYSVPHDHVRRLKRAVDCRVLAVDDLNRWDVGLVDWALAFSMAASTKKYCHTRAFRGPEFAPLRRAFRTAGTAVAREEDVCLVALGGLATRGLMNWAVAAVSQHYQRVRVARSAASGGPPPPAALSSRVVLLPPLPDLAAEIARCSLCLCTGGFTKYECIGLERPAVVIDQTDLERRDTLGLKRRGLLAGVAPAMDSRRLQSILRGLAPSPPRAALAERLHDAAFGSRTSDMIVEIMRGR